MLGRPRVLEARALGGLHDRNLVHDASMFVAVELGQHARAVEEPELHVTALSPRRRGAPASIRRETLPVADLARPTILPMPRLRTLVVASAFGAAVFSLAAC